MAQKSSPVVQDIWLLILRVVAAGSMLTHGIPKLLDLIQGRLRFPDPFGIGNISSLILAVGAEFFCSIFVLLGILTRWASIPVAFTMFTAIFFIHKNDSFQNKELAIMYFLLFGTISIFGSGNYALGKFLGNKN